jgi:uncharacterized protein (DUF983 family)
MNTKTFWIMSAVAMKCPRCHQGKMFPSKTLYSPAKFQTMNRSCSCCGLCFEPEPGYYFGAMFISYAFNTAYFVAAWIFLGGFVNEPSTSMILATLLTIVIGLFPITFRLSRVLWIYIFVRYDKTLGKEVLSASALSQKEQERELIN